MFKVSLFVLTLGIATWSQTMPQLKASAIDTGYIPTGFDSNDNVQFVIEGTYRDTCSKPAGTRFAVNNSAKTIQISTFEYRYPGPCLDMLVPHDEVISLGILQPGTYQVMQSAGRYLGRLNVTMATQHAPDDFLYAPVSQAYARNANGKIAITLSGTFTNSCMRFQKIAANIQGNVITVQPIAYMAQGPCANGRYPFEQGTTVSAPQVGRYLLHVRSLNGNSINTLFDFRLNTSGQ